VLFSKEGNILEDSFQFHIVISSIVAHLSDSMMKNTIHWYKLNEIYFDEISEAFSTFPTTSLKNNLNDNENISSKGGRNYNQPWIMIKFKFKFYFLIHETSLCVEKIEKIGIDKIEKKNKDDISALNFDMKISNLFILSVKSIVLEIDNMSDTIKFVEYVDRNKDQSMENSIFESSKLDFIVNVDSIDLDHVQAVPGGVCKIVGRYMYDIYNMNIYLNIMYLIYTYICICMFVIYLYIVYMGIA
jgi:hypothetical protein